MLKAANGLAIEAPEGGVQVNLRAPPAVGATGKERPFLQDPFLAKKGHTLGFPQVPLPPPFWPWPLALAFALALLPPLDPAPEVAA